MAGVTLLFLLVCLFHVPGCWTTCPMTWLPCLFNFTPIFRPLFHSSSLSRNAESNPTCVNDSQRSLLAAFWLRSQQNFPSHVGSSEAVGGGCTQRAAGFGRSSIGLQEQPDSEGAPADRWPGPQAVTFDTGCQLSPKQLVTRRQLLLPSQCK